MRRLFLLLTLTLLSCLDYQFSVEKDVIPEPAPQIEITPGSLSFSSINAGCEKSEQLIIKNAGNSILEIYDILYFITYPVDFSYDINEEENGEFPWFLAPEEEKTFTVTYRPSDDKIDSAFIEVESNDPINDVLTVDTLGDGKYYDHIEDSFEQSTLTDVDILFVVDNSGSMALNQSQLANNFDSFINIFAASGVDYQIAFITTDSAAFVGDIITPLMVDPITEANSQITSIGTGGSPSEKGIQMSYDALSSSGSAGPGSDFLRDNAKLVIIYISDEDDFSTITPTLAAAYFLALKMSSTYVVAHAVAGDYPGGCISNGGGAEAEDYYDLTVLMNGAFLSICAEDWGTPMEQLATESMANNTFALSESTPVVETIEVYVDGAKVYDWVYDDTYNSVVFNSDSIPAEDQVIGISYAIYGECD